MLSFKKAQPKSQYLKGLALADSLLVRFGRDLIGAEDEFTSCGFKG